MRIVSLLLCAVASFGLARAAAGSADAMGNPQTPPGEHSNAVQAGAAETPEAAAPAAPEPAAEAAPAEAMAEPAASPAPTGRADTPAPRRAKHKVALGPVGTDAAGQRGRIHTVASGDTLWDISDAYLGTPWVWPSVWQDNPDVPNPHRIFPGDKLWISPTAMRRVTDAEAEALLAGGGDLPAAIEDATPGPAGQVTIPAIDAVGFVSADVLAASGSILGDRREALMYAAEMPVYVSLGEGEVQKGDRFTVVRAEQDVRDPETGRTIGVFVDKLGWLEVTHVDGESSEAVIRASSRDMLAGDRLLPHSEPSPDVAVRPATPAVEGQIALFADTRTVTGGHDVVFLNRGSEHGLMPGSPLEVFRPGGVARDEESGRRKQLPDDVVASLVVVSAEPGTAVAVVTHAREELSRGDQFRGSAAH